MEDPNPINERIQQLELKLQNAKEHTKQLFQEAKSNPLLPDDLSASINLEKHKNSKLF